MEILGETIGTVVLVIILGVLLYGFYWILRYMLDGIRKHDD